MLYVYQNTHGCQNSLPYRLNLVYVVLCLLARKFYFLCILFLFLVCYPSANLLSCHFIFDIQGKQHCEEYILCHLDHPLCLRCICDWHLRIHQGFCGDWRKYLRKFPQCDCRLNLNSFWNIVAMSINRSDFNSLLDNICFIRSTCTVCAQVVQKRWWSSRYRYCYWKECTRSCWRPGIWKINYMTKST